MRRITNFWNPIGIRTSFYRSYSRLKFAIGIASFVFGCQKNAVSSNPAAGLAKNPTVQSTPLPGDEPQEGGRSVSIPGAKGAPTQLPESLGTPRTHYQTRSDIRLPIEVYNMQSGDQLELFQNNLGMSIFASELPDGFSAVTDAEKARYFLEKPEFSLGTAPQVGDTLGYDLIVRLAPNILLSQGKLSYGTNSLKLMLRTSNEDIEAVHPITIHDFRFFALGTSLFTGSNNTQRTSRYQGRASWIASPIVTSGNGELSVGSTSILNR